MGKNNLKKIFAVGGFFNSLRKFYILDSGGKRTINLKRAGVSLAVLFFVSASMLALFSKDEDSTFYRRTSQSQSTAKSKQDFSIERSNQPATEADLLFAQGEKLKEQDKLQAQEAAKHRVSMKYFAPQVLDANAKAPKAIRAGAKMLGFLLNNIDTRDPSTVRVLLPKGGEVMGVEIPSGSILSGQFSYNGSGNKVFITFHRLDASDGRVQKIHARALDSQDYSSGVRGEEFSENGVKVVSQLGLSMFAGMTDTLTEKESLGMGVNAVQAKPTMKNAVLQGMSKAAQDEAGRTASEIQSLKNYLVVFEGKEMIVQLLEDYH